MKESGKCLFIVLFFFFVAAMTQRGRVRESCSLLANFGIRFFVFTWIAANQLSSSFRWSKIVFEYHILL